MNRRIFLIAGAVVFVIALLTALWFVFFRGNPEVEVGGGDPFGGSGSGDIDADVPSVLEDGVEYSGEAGEEVAPRLVRITSAPVAAGTVALYIPEVPATTTPEGTVTPAIPPDVEVRFVERQSGNIYAYRAYARTLTRTSNQTIPGAQEAVWLSDGSMSFLRFLSASAGTERLETYALSANGETGYYLEADLAQLAATSSTSILSLRTSDEGSVATVARADGSSPRTAFTSPLSNLMVSFFGSGFLATTKASASLDGYAFIVSGTTGSFSRILGPLRGLTTRANPTGSQVLYSYSNRGTLSTGIVDVAGRVTTPLPIATHAEKCVFSRNGAELFCAVPRAISGEQPDDWYQGAVAFTDRIWIIDLQTRTASLVVDPSEVGGVAIDAISLSVDATSDILTFVNRRDGSLWAYDL